MMGLGEAVMHVRFWLVATAWSGFVGCDPTGDDASLPVLEVSPTAITLGAGGPGESVSGTFQVRNVGGGVLSVDQVLLEGPADFTLDQTQGLPVSLGHGEAWEASVSFTAAGAGPRLGRVEVRPSSPGLQPQSLAVTAYGAIGAIAVEPHPIELGEVPVGCVVRREVQVRNAGVEAVDITQIGPREGVPDLVVMDAPTTPMSLEAGGGFDLQVHATVSHEGPWTGALTLAHDAPLGPQTLPVHVVGVPRPPVVERFEIPEAGIYDLIYVVNHEARCRGSLDVLVPEIVALTDEVAAIHPNARVAVLTTRDTACFVDVVPLGDPEWAERLAAAIHSPSGAGMNEDGSAPMTASYAENVARATRSSVPDGCNAGFRTPGTPLHVVVFTNSFDESSGPAGPTYPDRWRPWFDEVRAWAEPGRLFWHVVTRTAALSARGANLVAPVTLTGGVLLEACDAPLGASIEPLVSSLTATTRRFPLAHPDVVTESLSVRINGVEQPDGWQIELSPPTLVLDARVVPGTQVEVSYVRVADCPI